MKMFKFNETPDDLKYPCAVCVNGYKYLDKCHGCKYLEPNADLTMEIERLVKKAVEEDA